MAQGYFRQQPLEGKRFGRLLVRAFSHRGKSGCAFFVCVCDCGKEKITRGDQLNCGKVKSCGCFRVDAARRKFTRHGNTKGKQRTQEYNTWKSMRQRCLNPDNKSFFRYGGRGITICKRWSKFENFLQDMGPRPAGLTLERINNEGHYRRSNCKWATPKEQANNRRPPRNRRDG